MAGFIDKEDRIEVGERWRTLQYEGLSLWRLLRDNGDATRLIALTDKGRPTSANRTESID